MPHLTNAQRAQYAEQGFLAGLRVFSPDEVAEIRTQIEAIEADPGPHDINRYFRVNGHVVLPQLAALARTPAILDAVETILGPDLLAWSVELFIKEPHSDKTVSWHQDITYWGMGETDDEVTAWVALSDVSVAAGCMRFIPGSHKGGIADHHDTFEASNLLSRGQQIADVDEADAVHGPLRPGEMSLHHGRCFHASGANGSDDRRIGLAIRYVTPHVREEAGGRDYAMPVRGKYDGTGWICIAGATSLFQPADLALYDQILADQSATLAAGATRDVSMYAGATA